MSADEATPVPAEMGRYRVLGPLACGGMAQVLLCRADGIEGFRKVVALKRILPRFAGDPEFIRMFLDEARLAAHLDHPNIVQVHDIGRVGVDYFYTMEYVHGESLLAVLREAAVVGEELALRHAIFVATEVLAGLHHAHERIGFDGGRLGLIHRDVSPSNVLVSYEGVVKVADFGIAKAAQSGVETTAGIRKGKLPYMAPEQCLGEELDPRADVWSLGVVLYEMTTGLRPFRGTTEFALMEQIVRGRPEPPSQHVPGYPPELEAVVMRALMRAREDRFASARAMRRELLGVARALDLHGSTEDLGATMRELFGERPLPWEGDGIGRDRPASRDETGRVAEAPTVAIAPPAGGRTRRRMAVVVAVGTLAVASAALAWPDERPAVAEASPSASEESPQPEPPSLPDERPAADPIAAPPASKPASTIDETPLRVEPDPAPASRPRHKPRPRRVPHENADSKPGLFDEFLADERGE